MELKTKFCLGQLVTLRTDIDQYARLITGIMITPNGLEYRLASGTNSTWHYESEIIGENEYPVIGFNKE